MHPGVSRDEREAEKERRENVCAAIACSVLGGGAVWRRWDIRGGPQGRHDFDLHFTDRHVEALEVCAFTEGEAEAQREALATRKRRESEVLDRYWLVGIPDRGLDLGRRDDDSFVSRVEELLAVYEAHDRFTFDPTDPWRLIAEVGREHALVGAANALARMGIKHSGSFVPPEGPPMIELQVTTGLALDTESVNRAIENRAMDEGNLKKLRAATEATARHLFVPIYPRAPMEFWAVEHVVLSSTPTLPPEVTRAWVVGAANGVLYVEPPGEWQRVSFDPLATSEPHRWERAE
jgi:hypothetical protein